MAVLVTGGAGFIGSHLVERLLADGREVVVLDDFDDYYDPAIKRENVRRWGDGPVTVVEGDIRDGRTVDRLFGQRGVGAVIHLAARAGVRPSIRQPRLYTSVNEVGTVTLLEAAVRHGIEGPFLFGSSSSVYGTNEKTPFSESDPVENPASPYAATKRAGELSCRAFHALYGLPVTCLRFFTVYGPRQRPEMAIHKFTRLIDSGEPIPMFGDGGSARDYTWVDDIVDGIVRALETALPWEILNLGGSRTTTLARLIGLISEALGIDPKIEHLPDQPGDVPITSADVSRAGRVIGWRPETPIEEGIPRFVDWYRSTNG